MAALLLACGSRVEVEGEGGGATSSITTSTSTATGGSSTGGSTTTGVGGQGGGPGCDAFHDEPGASSVTFRFVNDSGFPIFLPAHCGVVRFELNTSPPDGTQYAYDPFCLQSCEDLQTQGIIDCGACMPTSIFLPEGGSYDYVWDGTGLRSTDMPSECWAWPSDWTSCSQQLAARPGPYRATASGHAGCGDGEPCACDEQGVCWGEATGLEAYADSVQFSLASSGSLVVEVVFGVCAFPCPEGS